MEIYKRGCNIFEGGGDRTLQGAWLTSAQPLCSVPRVSSLLRLFTSQFSEEGMEMLEFSHLARVTFALKSGRWGWWPGMGADKAHRKWGLPGWLLVPALGPCP